MQKKKEEEKSAGEGSHLEAAVKVREDMLVDNNHRGWKGLHHQLLNSKVSDAFSNFKYNVNGRRFRVLKKMGEGGFGKVYKVFSDSNELYALKVVDFTSDEERKITVLLEEIKLLEMFSHNDRVIHMYEYEVDREGCVAYMLMECGDISLQAVITNLRQENNLTRVKLKYFWEEMLQAVQVVHSHRVIHCDIKPENFLFVGGRLKIIDFGMAGIIPLDQDSIVRRFVGGTSYYRCPEAMSCYEIDEGEMAKNLVINLNLSLKVDIWSLGVILHQFAYDDVLPFATVPGGKLSKLKATISPDLPVILAPIEDINLMHSIQWCLEKRPENRANIEDLIAHKFLH